MNLNRILSASFYLKAIFVLSLIVLIFISGLTYRHSKSLAESTEWLVHTYKTNIQLEQLFSYLKDAESSQRGYIITHDTLFLAPYYSARQKVNSALMQLSKLAETNQQHQHLDTLYQLIDSRLIQLEVSLSVNKDNPNNSSLLKTSLEIGKDIMDKIRLQVSRMNALEMDYLDERQAKYEYKISITPLFSMLLLLFALSMFIFSYWRINKDLNTLMHANEKLQINSESMAHSEEIGAFSSWHWNLKTNKLVFSDNQYRLLGCPPQSFNPTIENFLEFVHPQDKPLVASGIKHAKEINAYPIGVFRITRKDGMVRYFKTLSKLMPDMFGTNILIGANMDITEHYLNTVALKEQNRELEQKNKELASFNHVASHDLQEPLRIVQTYISRLNEKETERMTDKGRDYITRIKVSISRMRTLIDALLLFSRTNRVENIFEIANLNLLLDNAKQDLAQSIEQKKAIITASQLPTMNVIPFQIQQLFTNLIGNSLKYSRPDVPLQVNIECEKVTSQEQLELKLDVNRKYYKISVEDNGIGFEQHYGDHIFILFQRLHHADEYEGTGIGLAICKKIVENHSGFISAEGRPGEGSSFYVYLPV
jgi:signal transduction histidine kinase/CHASE3 domain sensor protein